MNPFLQGYLLARDQRLRDAETQRRIALEEADRAFAEEQARLAAEIQSRRQALAEREFEQSLIDRNAMNELKRQETQAGIELTKAQIENLRRKPEEEKERIESAQRERRGTAVLGLMREGYSPLEAAAFINWLERGAELPTPEEQQQRQQAAERFQSGATSLVGRLMPKALPIAEAFGRAALQSAAAPAPPPGISPEVWSSIAPRVQGQISAQDALTNLREAQAKSAVQRAEAYVKNVNRMILGDRWRQEIAKERNDIYAASERWKQEVARAKLDLNKMINLRDGKSIAWARLDERQARTINSVRREMSDVSGRLATRISRLRRLLTTYEESLAETQARARQPMIPEADTLGTVQFNAEIQEAQMRLPVLQRAVEQTKAELDELTAQEREINKRLLMMGSVTDEQGRPDRQKQEALRRSIGRQQPNTQGITTTPTTGTKRWRLVPGRGLVPIR